MVIITIDHIIITSLFKYMDSDRVIGFRWYISHMLLLSWKFFFLFFEILLKISSKLSMTVSPV
jgi:hypothetical protein